MTTETTDGHVSSWLADLARAPAPDEDVLVPGDMIGDARYRIERELARGGMGLVYVAEDTKLARRVAVKTHRVRSSDWRRQLMVEAQAMAKLSHPNVVAVHDVGEFDGGVFLVADYITGGDLRSWSVPSHPWRDVLRAYVDAGRGLAYSHEAGVVHGDFKPSNVLLTDQGRSQVTDFGLATHADLHTREEPLPALSDTDEAPSGLVGTPAFMAPEQLAGAPATAKTDQFSFCVALCEALLGDRPYRRDSRELLTSSRPLRPGSSGVPGKVLRVLDRGLSVSPDQRHSSMSALLDALEGASAARRFPWASVGVTGLAGVVALSLTQREQPDCEPATVPLSAWTDDGRDALRTVFAGDPRALQRWPSTERTVDTFVDAWKDASVTACEQELTGAHLCLDALGRDANATLLSLQRASPKATQNGLQRVEAWTDPSACLQPGFGEPSSTSEIPAPPSSGPRSR